MRVIVITCGDLPVAAHQMPAAPDGADLYQWHREVATELKIGYEDEYVDARGPVRTTMLELLPVPFDLSV